MIEDDDYAALQREADAAHRRRYQLDLAAHPSCSDPDHPGCPACIDEPEEE